MKTVDKIKSVAEKAAKERLENEQAKLQESTAKDLDVLDQIIEMVKDRLIYKSVDSRPTRYEVVTEDTVFKDYTTKPDGYNDGKTGIFHQEASYYSISQTVIRVNGHTYYHAQDLFKKYEWEIKQAKEKSEKERKIIQEKEDALTAMKELEPIVKSILLNYQKHLEVKK